LFSRNWVEPAQPNFFAKIRVEPVQFDIFKRAKNCPKTLTTFFFHFSVEDWLNSKYCDIVPVLMAGRGHSPFSRDCMRWQKTERRKGEKRKTRRDTRKEMTQSSPHHPRLLHLEITSPTQN